MKISLQKRSARTAGLAIAIGLTAAIHSAQAALVQITLGGSNWTFTSSSHTSQLDVTGDSSLDAITFYNQGWHLILTASQDIANAHYKSQLHIALAYFLPQQENPFFAGYRFDYGGFSAFTFTDARINNGSPTTGWAQGSSLGGGGGSSPFLSVYLDRVVFDDVNDGSPLAPYSNFDPNTTYNEWVPASTAVPEPGTFIPAAMLVMGALLRRRRGRASRSGSAAA